MNRERNYIQYSMKYYIYYYENLVSYYSHYYTYIFFITCCPKNTLICKLDLVYRYIVYNEKTLLWPFLHTFCRKKKGIESFCYNIV